MKCFANWRFVPHVPKTFRRPCKLERQNPWLLSVNGVATQALSFFASANGRKPNFPHVHQYHERTWNGSDQKRWFWFPFCVSYIAPVKRSFTASQCTGALVQCCALHWCSAVHCSAVAAWQLPIILICFVLLRFPSSRRFNRCGSHHYCASAHQYKDQWAAAAAALRRHCCCTFNVHRIHLVENHNFGWNCVISCGILIIV